MAETLSEKPIFFVLDIDRVLVDTEQLYSKGFDEIVPYAEDEGALDKLRALGTICLFSEITVNGSRELQEKKIKRLELDKYAAQEDTYITSDKRQTIPAILDKYIHGLIVVVDDRIEVLEEFMRAAQEKNMASQVITFWVQRGPHAQRAIAEKRPLGSAIPVLNLTGVVVKVPQVIKERIQVPA